MVELTFCGGIWKFCGRIMEVCGGIMFFFAVWWWDYGVFVVDLWGVY